MIGRIVMHQSRLNVIEIRRGLARIWAGGDVIAISEAVTTDFANGLVVALQLAVEAVFNFRPFDRIGKGNPFIRQLFAEASYRTSAIWEGGGEMYDESNREIARYLCQRIGLTVQDTGVPTTEERDSSAKSPEELTLQAKFGAELCQDLYSASTMSELLTDFKLIRELAENNLSASQTLLASAISTGPGLKFFREVAGHPNLFEFVFDSAGRNWKTRLPHRGSEGRNRFDELSSAVGLFSDALEAAGTAGPELVASGLLPSTVSWGAIEDVQAKGMADLVSDRSDRFGHLLPVLEMFALVLQRCGRGIWTVLTLAVQIRHSLQSKIPLPMLVGRVARYVDVSAVTTGRDVIAPGISSPPDVKKPSEIAVSLRESIQSVAAKTTGADVKKLQNGRWRAWGDAVSSFLSGRSSGLADISLDDLVLAAGDLPPGNLFRPDLATMTPRDWTTLCLVSAQAVSGDKSVPGWACLAGLAALQCPHGVLEGVANALASRWDVRSAEDFLPSGPGREFIRDSRRALVITSGMVTPLASKGRGGAFLIVARDDVSRYGEALRWLREQNVFNEVLDELDPPSEALDAIA
jgi:hypothetical protein